MGENLNGRSPAPEPGRHVGRMGRSLWLALGLLFVALGLIGMLLPLMPTTIFLILAAACFARSSPRLEARLLDHPRLGPPVRAWRDQRAIGRKAKLMACTGIAAGYGLFCWAARPSLPVELLTGGAMAAAALFVVSRPNPQ